MRRLGRRELLAGLCGAAAAAPAMAQTIHMMGPEEAIALEHQTRSRRLRRLVRELGITPDPEFYEYIIPAAAMPEGSQRDTPVLRVVFPESTFFSTDEAKVLPSAYGIIAAMAGMLQGDVPDVATFVAGHADNRGSEPYNYDLSMRRARAVAEALRDAGANLPDIWSVGFGESLPLYENSSPINMAYNRRVEFLFGAKPEALANWLKDQKDLACTGGGEMAKHRCLVALRVRKAYVVQSVDRRTVVSAPRAEPGQVVRPNAAKVIVRPKPRQIVINLAERTYVVSRPEF